MSKPILTEKPCNKCGEIFPNTLEYFRVGRPGKTGATCRKCHCAVKKNWRQNNPDKVAAEKKRSHERHRETDNARVKRWADENRDYKREQDRQYRLDHLEERRAYEAQWQRDNPDKVKARNQRWVERHPEQAKASAKVRQLTYRQSMRGKARRQMRSDLHRDEIRAYNRMRYLIPVVRERHLAKARRRRMAEGNFTPSDIRALYDEQEGRCAYCGITLHGHYHLDHLIPLARGGTHNPDNLRIACPTCNMSKGAKLIEEWELVRGW